MSLNIEDGSAVADAEAYFGPDVVSAYAQRYGKVFVPENPQLGEAVCRVASQWVDATYRARLPGYRVKGRSQGLEWPRRAAYIPMGGVAGWGFEPLPDNVIPKEVIQAGCEAAIRELAEPGSLSPDLSKGGGIVNVQAGSASVTWAGGGLSEEKTFTAIDNIMAGILPAINPYCGTTGRG